MEKTERKWSARITDGRTIGRKCAFVVGLHNDSAYEDCIASIELNHKEDAEGWFEKYSKIAECMNAHSELQAKANISDEAIKAFQEIIRNQCDEISAIKEKAEAYDRLMSGEPTAKEIANVLNRIIAMDADFKWNAFGAIPYGTTKFRWVAVRGSTKYRVPCFNIKFDGDWKDSLTFPDGWREK